MNVLASAMLLALALASIEPTEETLKLAENAIIWLDGRAARLEDFPEGTTIKVGIDPDGRIGFLFGTSPRKE